MSAKPTCAALSTPRVPRKSRSPSALTRPDRTAEAERGGDRLQRHAGAGDQRLQQHVSRTEFQPVAAGRGMKPGNGERTPGLDLAGDRSRVERSFGAKGHASGAGFGAIAIFRAAPAGLGVRPRSIPAPSSDAIRPSWLRPSHRTAAPASPRHCRRRSSTTPTPIAPIRRGTGYEARARTSRLSRTHVLWSAARKPSTSAAGIGLPKR